MYIYINLQVLNKNIPSPGYVSVNIPGISVKKLIQNRLIS